MKRVAIVLISLGLIVSLAGCARKDRRELVKESHFYPDGRFVDLDGRETYIVEKGEGQPIILIHGLGASIYSWRDIIDPLAEEYRVFALDLWGFGYSSKPDIDYDYKVYSKQVMALIDKFELDEVTLIGNSLGGMISANLAIQRPEKIKSLVLIDAAGYGTDQNKTPFLFELAKVPGVRDVLALFNSKSRIRGLLEEVYYNDAHITDEVVEAYYSPLQTEGSMRASLDLLSGGLKTDDFASKIREIQAPSLIIWGQEDEWIPLTRAYRYHKDLPNSDLVILTGAGHVPQEEVPGTVVDRIMEFLNNIKY